MFFPRPSAIRARLSTAAALLLAFVPRAFITSAESAQPEATEVLAQWRESVQPLLAEHCVGCHGPVEQSSQLSLRSLAELMDGGQRGAAIDHAAPEASLLVRVLGPDAEPHMPPDEQLDENSIAEIRDWVQKAAAVDAEELTSLAQKPVGSADSPTYPPGVDPALVIDLAIQAGWQTDDASLQTALLCDDSTFVRRVYLDLIGRIPTPQQRDSFLQGTASDKRERLIDQLLRTQEHATHFAELFDTQLMGRGDTSDMKQRERHGWIEFLTTAFAENRPWDQAAQQMLLARPQSPDEQGATWYLYERRNKHQQIAEAISRGIFGVQIQCAQCHDHPLAAEIKQAHYWGLVAFFNRSENVDTPAGPRVAESAIGGFSMFTNLSGASQPNRLVYLRTDPVPEPRPAEGEKQEDRDELYVPGEEGQPRTPRFSRRQQFVDQVLDGHPLVARAMVNRLWALMMGRGLVHPVDQLDSTHPPSHPDLLDWLADDFERSGYDVRRLLSQIARSRTYQLSSTSDAAFVDPARFAVAAAKPLSAEALYRSMLVALDCKNPEQRQTPEQLAEYRRAFPDVLPEESIASLRQALLLTNGPDIHNLLLPEQSGTVAKLIELPDSRSIAERAFVHVLGRPASEEELQRSVEFLDARTDRPHRGVDQLVWTLLTTAEFRFNH